MQSVDGRILKQAYAGLVAFFTQAASSRLSADALGCVAAEARARAGLASAHTTGSLTLFPLSQRWPQLGAGGS